MNSWEHDGDLDFIIDYLIECTDGWESEARLLGNARAQDIVRAIKRLKNSKEWYAKRCQKLQDVQKHMRDPERKWVCDILANNATDVTSSRTSSALALAKQFHEAYERLAPSFGYETRPETREFDPDSVNGRLMVAVCQEVIYNT